MPARRPKDRRIVVRRGNGASVMIQTRNTHYSSLDPHYHFDKRVPTTHRIYRVENDRSPRVAGSDRESHQGMSKESLLYQRPLHNRREPDTHDSHYSASSPDRHRSSRRFPPRYFNGDAMPDINFDPGTYIGVEATSTYDLGYQTVRVTQGPNGHSVQYYRNSRPPSPVYPSSSSYQKQRHSLSPTSSSFDHSSRFHRYKTVGDIIANWHPDSESHTHSQSDTGYVDSGDEGSSDNEISRKPSPVPTIYGGTAKFRVRELRPEETDDTPYQSEDDDRYYSDGKSEYSSRDARGPRPGDSDFEPEVEDPSEVGADHTYRPVHGNSRVLPTSRIYRAR